MGMITVQRNATVPLNKELVHRECFCCGSRNWLKITLVGVGATSFALCPECAETLAMKIEDVIGRTDDGK